MFVIVWLCMCLYCSYLSRVKSRSQGRDYRIFYLDLVESRPSLLFIILFEWWKHIIWPFKLDLNKIHGDLDLRSNCYKPKSRACSETLGLAISTIDTWVSPWRSAHAQTLPPGGVVICSCCHLAVTSCSQRHHLPTASAPASRHSCEKINKAVLVYLVGKWWQLLK